MKTYWILWTYEANYSHKLWERQGETPEHAMGQVLAGFSEHFRQKGKMYVFDRPPVATHNVE